VQIFHSIREIQRAGTAILLVEQDALSALAIAGRGYVMEHGRIAREGTSADLSRDDYIRQVYLGV
jgi:branched-chain amino acid transport system ATP-binding protein